MDDQDEVTEDSANAALRRTALGSTDPRVGRTRARILTAVQDLGAAGDELSVSSIARTAGVSRAAFYSHYAGVDDLAVGLRRDAFTAISELYGVERDVGPDALLVSQQRLVAHYAEHRGLYRAVAALPTSADADRAAVRTMAELIADALRITSTLPPGLDLPASARYIASAAYGLLDAWIRDEITLDETQLVEHLLRLLPPWFNEPR